MANPLDWLLATVTQKFGPTSEPLDGSYNGYPHFNKGWDFAVPTGTEIGSNVGGVVTSVSNDPNAPNGWGISVVVKDDNGFLHHFSHLSAASVGMGQMVNIGTVLGKSGSTGASTGPHLSYDVEDNTGKFVDPSRFLAGSAAGVPASGGGSGSGGLDIPVSFPSIPNPLDGLSGIPGALKNGFDVVAAPFQKLAEVAIWLLNPQHWFKLFFIVAGTGLVAMGLYVYVRGTSGIESDVTTAGKLAAVGA